jgi:hypothetical protein
MTSPDVEMTKAELSAAIDEDQWPGMCVARTAKIAHRCVCADQMRPSWWVKVTSAGTGNAQSYKRTREEIEELAGRRRAQYPGAGIEVGQDPNPNYRPDCLGVILPGDVYADYLGESAAYQSGRPYCRRCAVAVWGPK